MSIILVLRNLRQEDFEFKTNLGYIASLSYKTKPSV